MSTSTPSVASKAYLLPPEDLHSTLSSIELLSAMWSGTDELQLTTTDEQTIRRIAEYLQLELETLGDQRSVGLKDSIADEVVLGLKIRVDAAAHAAHAEQAPQQAVWIKVAFRLRKTNATDARVSMWTSAKDAPSWLDRARVDEVNEMLAKYRETTHTDEHHDTVGSILNAIEEVSELLALDTSAESVAPPQSTALQPTCSAPLDASSPPPLVLRTWYYLPSLSTKSKRADIVSLALSSTPPLTGFLLAGKPGLIVLEHPLTCALTTATANLASFWSTIKTTSWSDIPASHKKISEKLIQPDVQHAFTGFQDITDLPEVESGADRGRKTDLSKLVVWLDNRGVQGKWCLERVLGVGGWET
ncbi:uncharacterized protein UMAG_03930 [Mycosarcoma maydis]|uniref:Uncharacterized protein n=1 Tax=Mycosarcoma maydis TaxID=5270 RepID=A0A0D1DUA8_MYCMD|nr:uncharacterized protein UMAG_03930 [Ustilago maydis 521]KIS67874.1 hypothetical protein UMAG_03930 [Ustilago maydis 521]|eukprot:XP_011390402.1 hypothetical protein UMAG_03930 [Ustilago maydis 521]